MGQVSTFRAVMTSSTALLLLVAACSDGAGPVAIAPAASVRNTTSFVPGSGHGTGYSAQIKLCVDASSPAGTYKFRNSSWNSGLALAGYGVNFNGVWYDQGDGGEGYGAAGGSTTWSPAKGDNSEYTVAVGSCVVVMNRTQPSDHYATDLMDDWQAVNMTASSWPAGATFDHVDCVGDQGVVNPQPTPCGSNSNPTRAFANYDHGIQVTFVFAALQQQQLPVHNCVYSQGYMKNHEAYVQSVLSGNAGTTYVDGSGKLLIGAYALSAAQIDAIIEVASGKAYNAGGVVFTKDQIPMIQQLIAAELNIAAGASSSGISATIAAANAGYQSASNAQLLSWTKALDSFNTGKTGVPHCA